MIRWLLRLILLLLLLLVFGSNYSIQVESFTIIIRQFREILQVPNQQQPTVVLALGRVGLLARRQHRHHPTTTIIRISPISSSLSTLLLSTFPGCSYNNKIPSNSLLSFSTMSTKISIPRRTTRATTTRTTTLTRWVKTKKKNGDDNDDNGDDNNKNNNDNDDDDDDGGSANVLSSSSSSFSSSPTTKRRRRTNNKNDDSNMNATSPKIKRTPCKNKKSDTLLDTTLSSSSVAATALSNNGIKSCENNNDDNSKLLLKSFLQHDSIEFHKFTNEEATAIRFELLNWYRQYRRKLPWRGDPAPWNGSTSNFITNIATNTTNKNDDKSKKANKSNSNNNQTSMKNFFKTSSSSSSSTRSSTRSKQQQQSIPPESITSADLTTSTDTTTTTTTNNNNNNIEIGKSYPITPYGVWVSEIMLQQTRVDAVIPYWVKWMELFPTVEVLANATPDQVNAAWAGLGFYRRARFLHDAAKVIVNQYNGTLPSTSQELQKLPGIGRYTACAIASIAYNERVAVVDGNVCRVLSRLRCIAQSIKVPIFKDTYGWILAQQLIDAVDDNSNNDKEHYAGEVNQALMEIGATYCAPAGTGIDLNDPLRKYYWSTRLGYAVRTTEPSLIQQWLHERVASSSNNKNPTTTTTKQKKQQQHHTCPVCSSDGGGIEDVITTLLETIQYKEEQNNVTLVDDENARKCGHAAFPLAPVKTAKRVEVYTVVAISRSLPTTVSSTSGIGRKRTINESTKQWLLVKRPNTGLLAGQWEFPSVCVWSSATNTSKAKKVSSDTDDDDDDGHTKKSSKSKSKTKGSTKSSTVTDPVPAKIPLPVRRKVIEKMVQEILQTTKSDNKKNKVQHYLHSSVLKQLFSGASTSNKKSNNNNNILKSVTGDDEPLEHIFSHIRHYMYVDYGQIIYENNNNNNDDDDDESSLMSDWIDSKGRQVRWMDENEMQSVGITAGVHKILAAVRKH